MRARSRLFAFLLTVLAAAVVAGCGGGGSAPSPASVPTHRAAENVTGTLRLILPASSAQGHGRNAAWVSPSVKSAIITVNGTPSPAFDVSSTSQLCTTSGSTRTCALSVGAPAGSDTFAVALYDAPSGGGTLLGSGSATQTVSVNTPFNVTITAAGVPAKLVVSVVPAQFTPGTPGTATVTVSASDADGNAIAGPYTQTITLTNSDTTGTFTLSASTIAYGQTVTLSYKGSGSASSATIGASAPGVSPSNVQTQNVVAGAAALLATPLPLPTSTSLSRLWDLTVGSDNTIWVVDNGSGTLASVDPNGGPVRYVATGTPRQIGIAKLGTSVWWFGGSFPAKLGAYATDLTPGVTATLPPGSRAAYLTAGPDGNLWGIDEANNKIAQVTAAGVVTEFAVSGITTGFPANAHITTGPDGALWFTVPEENRVVRMTTGGTVTNSFPLPTPSGFSVDPGQGNPHGIASGPDGNLWIAEAQTGRIAKMTTAGAVTEYAVPTALPAPEAIVAGPDGNLWFTAPNYGVGKITTAGSVTVFTVGGANGALGGYGIVSGPGGALYTTTALSSGQKAILRFPPQ